MEIGIEGETVRAGSGNVASGQQYAQQIAGGMPMSQVIAPGVSYSPDQPGGYTQADLNVIANLGIAPVMQPAPTQGPSYTIEDQMEYAPPGTTVRDLVPNEIIEPYLEFIPNYNVSSDIPFADISANTRFAPELSQDGNYYVPSKFDLDVEAFMEGVDPEILRNVDLTNLDLPQSPGRPGIDYFPEPRDPFILKDFFSLPGQEQDTAGLLDPQPGSSSPSVVPTMPELPDFSGTGESVATSFMPGGDSITDFLANQGVATDRESLIGKTLFGQTITPESFGERETAKSPFFSAVPRPDLPTPNISGPFGFINKPAPVPVMPSAPVAQEPVYQIPNFPIQQPMNFTGLPQVPVMPEPIIQKPVIPQIPINIPNIPMNFTGLPNIPVPPAAQVYIPPPPPVPPVYTQPRVEDIIAPIRTGSPRRQQQPGLFSLV